MNIVAKLPAIKPEIMAGTALTPVRTVDAHSLLHQRASKSVKACDAADVVDGLAVLQNLTLRLVATAYGVSLGSVARARRLTPEQRQAVRQRKRPLLLPRTPPALPAPVSAQQKLAEVVAEVGADTAVDMIAALDCSAAA
jgi:hypothetical protein